MMEAASGAADTAIAARDKLAELHAATGKALDSVNAHLQEAEEMTGKRAANRGQCSDPHLPSEQRERYWDAVTRVPAPQEKSRAL